MIVSLRCGPNKHVHSKENVVEGNDAVNGGIDGGSTMNKWTNNAYDNNAYTTVTVEQAVELKYTNRTRSTENVHVKKSGKHHPSTSNGLHVPTNHSSVNEGFQESKESVGKLNQENLATPKQFERNTVANDSTDGVVLSFQNVPAEMKAGISVAANASNQTNSNDPEEQNKRSSEADINDHEIYV